MYIYTYVCVLFLYRLVLYVCVCLYLYNVVLYVCMCVQMQVTIFLNIDTTLITARWPSNDKDSAHTLSLSDISSYDVTVCFSIHISLATRVPFYETAICKYFYSNLPHNSHLSAFTSHHLVSAKQELYTARYMTGWKL